MNFRSPRRRQESFHLDLTPMIDVIMMLVLFLVMSTTFRKPEDPNKGEKGPGIQVDLPRSSAQTVITERKDINVWMSADGSVFVDQAPVSAGDLQSRFKRAARVDPTTLVVIKADKGVAHGRVVSVMDMARNEGLTRLAIATTVGEGEQL